MTPLVSVIVPFFNAEKTIEACLQSIQNQTFKNLEIVLVNDGSTDKSQQICNKYAQNDNRIKIISQKNKGVSSARNIGLDNSIGEWVSFVDSDDIIRESYIYHMLELCKEYDADIARCASIEVQDYNDVNNYYYLSQQHKEFVLSSEEALEPKNLPHTIWGGIYKKELFDGIRFPEGRLSEDTAVIYKLLYYSSKIVFSNEILYFQVNNSKNHLNYKKEGEINQCDIDAITAFYERAIFFDNSQKEKLANYSWNSFLFNYLEAYTEKARLSIENREKLIDNRKLIINNKRRIIHAMSSLKLKIAANFFIALPALYKMRKINMKKTIHKILSTVYYFVFNNKNWRKREKKRTYGKLNPDKTIYIIRMNNPNFGLLTVWKFVVGHLDYALKKGYIPIVDLKNYYVPLLQDENKKGKENAWEYYFNQPQTNISLDEAYKSKNVILSFLDVNTMNDKILHEMPMEISEIHYWNDIASKMGVKKQICENADKEMQLIKGKYKKILGVSVRVGYNALKERKYKVVDSHPKQPEMDMLIKDVKKYLSDWNCDACLLVIDDDNMGKIISNEIGENCIFRKRKRTTYYNENGEVLENVHETYWMKRQKLSVQSVGEDYLTELVLLSKCDCFLAGRSSGNLFAYTMNNGSFENSYIYDIGLIQV